jgi:DNA-binding transcriptional ArsR family regulator
MERREVIAGLGALAQETRLDIVRYLVRKGPDGAVAGAIGAQVGVPSATLAFHLNILTGTGLLVRRRSSRNVIYRVDYGRLHNITAYLLDNCCAETGEVVTRDQAHSAGEPTSLDSYRAQSGPPAKRRRS